MDNLRPQDFWERLIASKLLDENALRQARRIVDRQSDPSRSASDLVHRGYLTRWQAHQLLSGEKTKFFIGKYKLLKLLGKGAMGYVFKASQPVMKRAVALKVMSREILHDERAIARFQREIRAVALLDHPHIARALDAGQVRQTHYLVMEYIEGKDLQYWINVAGPLPIDWSCECIRQVAAGLQHAHQQGLVHRDLKPSNLLLVGKSLTPRPFVKVVDFGLAQVADDPAREIKLTRIGRTVGSFNYMAPEQARDSITDIRSDIYSLGCTLFQMISGQLPFQGKSQIDILRMRLERDPPALSSVRREVDPELDRVVARMLARDSTQRFQIPAELATALTPFARRPQINSHGPELKPAAREPRSCVGVQRPTTASEQEHLVITHDNSPTDAGTSDSTDGSLDTFWESLSRDSLQRIGLEVLPHRDKTSAWRWWVLRIIVIIAIGLCLWFNTWIRKG